MILILNSDLLGILISMFSEVLIMLNKNHALLGILISSGLTIIFKDNFYFFNRRKTNIIAVFFSLLEFVLCNIVFTSGFFMLFLLFYRKYVLKIPDVPDGMVYMTFDLKQYFICCFILFILSLVVYFIDKRAAQKQISEWEARNKEREANKDKKK